VIFPLVELDGLSKVLHLPVDPSAKSLLINLIQQLLKLALAASHNGRHYCHPLALTQLDNAQDDLLCGLPRDGAATVGAMRHADRRVEESQVVVNLGDGSHSGTGAAAGGFLLNRDCRAQALDRIHVGALDLIEKLPGVGGKRLNIPPLPFGVDGVKGKRTLSRAGQSGDYRQGVSRDADVDIAQVMLARTAHRNVGDRHAWRIAGGRCRKSGIRFDPEAEQHYGGILVVNRKAGQRNAISATIAELPAQMPVV